MKKFLPAIILCHMTAVGAQSQTSMGETMANWAERAVVQGHVLPQEYIYVHMDNTCYFKGDTLHYKAYVNRSDTGKPTDMSRVLYTELLDNDGYLIERQILRLRDGQAHGTFCLNDILYGGYYELRAYTRWNLNFGVYEHEHSKRTKEWFFNRQCEQEYFRDYDKLYSRVFPVYNKPREKGNYEHSMSLRPLRRYFKTKKEKPEADVRLYPEGGRWVEGIKQRCAYEACSPEGKHLDGTLTVYDGEGRIVATSTTEHRGRGVFTMTGHCAERYKAVFRWGDGNEQRIKIPEPEREGVVLWVSQTDDSLRLHTEVAGAPVMDTLAYIVMHNGMLQQYGLAGTDVSISSRDMPDGVAQVMILDRQGRIWADRLVFIRHKTLEANNVTFKGMKETYAPYEKVTLQLASAHASQAVVSIAVRDAALSAPTYDDGTMLTEMLLGSQIKGFVESPGYYFEVDDSIHRRHLDLLLMVQGWRRHRWVDVTQPVTLYHTVERQRYLAGQVWNLDMPYKERYDPEGIDRANWTGSKSGDPPVGDGSLASIRAMSMFGYTSHRGSGPIYNGRTQYFNYDPYYQDESEGSVHDDQHNLRSRSQLKNEVLVHADFTKPGSEGIIGDVVTRDGKFTIPMPDYDGMAFMHLASSDTTKWPRRFKHRKDKMIADEYPWIVRDDEDNVKSIPEHYVRLSFPYPRFVKPYSYYQTDENMPMPEEQDLAKTRDADNVTTMREFVVMRKHGGLRGFDRSTPAFKLDAYDAFNAVVDAGLHAPVLYTDYVFDLAVAANYVCEMGIKERAYEMIPRWGYYDDSHPMGSVTHFHYRQLCYLDSVYVYTDYSPRKEGDERYSQDNQPMVEVDLHLLPDDGKRPAYQNRFYVMPGYNVCEDFYHPDYSHQRPEDCPEDYRRTLYWNPNLRLDASGQAVVTFYNNSRRNQLSVEAEGITGDGSILTGKR